MSTKEKSGYAFMSDEGWEEVPEDAFAAYAKGVRENVIPQLKEMQKQKEVDAAEAMSCVLN